MCSHFDTGNAKWALYGGLRGNEILVGIDEQEYSDRLLARDIIVEQEREMLVMRGAAGEATSAESTDAPEAALWHATGG